MRALQLAARAARQRTFILRIEAPTSNARRPKWSPAFSTGCGGSASTGTKDRKWAGRMLRTFSRNGSNAIAPRPDSCSTAPGVSGRGRDPVQGAGGKDVVHRYRHGPIEFDNEHIENFVILRSDTHPTYHLSVVVDDIDMAITHVVRGDDHISTRRSRCCSTTRSKIRPPSRTCR